MIGNSSTTMSPMLVWSVAVDISLSFAFKLFLGRNAVKVKGQE